MVRKLNTFPAAGAARDNKSRQEVATVSVAAAGLELEIFLDMMAAMSSSTTYFLIASYNNVLSNEEAVSADSSRGVECD